MGEAGMRVQWAGVPAEQLDMAWPLIAPSLERALSYSLGEMTLRQVYEGIRDRSFQLWALGSDDTVDLGVCVTQVVTSPVTRYLEVLLCAGSELDSWIEYVDVLEQFAASNGCDFVKVHGRPGWERKLKKFGFEKKYVILTKPVATRH